MKTPGRLEVVVGPMFGGKTTELIRRVQEYAQKGERVDVYKPRLDTRHEEAAIISHDGLNIPAKWVGPDWSAPFQSNAQCIAFDEVQFFPPSIIADVASALRRGVHVIAAGLDLTSGEQPFGPVPQLLALADEVVKIATTCAKCGGVANRSQRIVNKPGTILIGGSDAYEPRCLVCFEPNGG